MQHDNRKFQMNEEQEKCRLKKKSYSQPVCKKIGGINITKGTTGLNNDVSGEANNPGAS